MLGVLFNSSRTFWPGSEGLQHRSVNRFFSPRFFSLFPSPLAQPLSCLSLLQPLCLLFPPFLFGEWGAGRGGGARGCPHSVLTLSLTSLPPPFLGKDRRHCLTPKGCSSTAMSASTTDFHCLVSRDAAAFGDGRLTLGEWATGIRRGVGGLAWLGRGRTDMLALFFVLCAMSL